jgi:hypothetical protein
MSGGKHGHISKGKVHTLVDTALNNPANNFARRTAFNNDLLAAGPTVDDYLAVLRNRAGVPAQETGYLKQTWYNEGIDLQGPIGWWLWLQPIHLIIRKGLIKAIELANRDPDTGNARNPPLPIDSYWITSGNEVEVILTVDGPPQQPRQVTRIILTPPSPGPTPRRTRLSPMWVIRRDLDTQGRETDDEVVEVVDTANKIITRRQKES